MPFLILIFAKKIALADTFDIFEISGRKQFDKTALQVFRHQYAQNQVYRQFCDLLNVKPDQVRRIEQIPFLPIDFFKTRDVCSSDAPVQEIFSSSGTTSKDGAAAVRSRHLVTDLSVYEQSFRKAFARFYGNVEDYVILALLPSYLERDGSSLIYMAADLIEGSGKPDSGFYLNDYEGLIQKLTDLDRSGQNVLLLGVTYALLDLVERQQFHLEHTIVMETGGMKGRRKEMIREELHNILSRGFGVDSIHSEYGMTELLSQAYSFGQGLFECPPWMQVLIRDPEDPFTYVAGGKSGGINVIDLANYNSCSFIATQDLGRMQGDRFEVLGRFDNADIRGCNLMVI